MQGARATTARILVSSRQTGTPTTHVDARNDDTERKRDEKDTSLQRTQETQSWDHVRQTTDRHCRHGEEQAVDGQELKVSCHKVIQLRSIFQHTRHSPPT